MMFRAGAFLRVYGGDQGQVHSTGKYILFIVYYTIIKKCINYNTILIMKYEILVLYMIVLHWDHAASSKIIKVETVSECSSPGGVPVSPIAHVVGKCDIV